MDYIQIGHLKKTYGLNGELKSFVEERFWEDLLEADVVFVEIKGQKIPFFIEEIKDGGDILLKFEEVDDRDSAVELSGKPLFMRVSDLSEQHASLSFEDRLPGLIGFTIVTEEGLEVGPISELIEMPMQVLAMIEKKDEEILIPLAEDFIVDILEKEKKLIMSLPEGLLEL